MSRRGFWKDSFRNSRFETYFVGTVELRHILNRTRQTRLPGFSTIFMECSFLIFTIDDNSNVWVGMLVYLDRELNSVWRKGVSPFDFSCWAHISSCTTSVFADCRWRANVGLCTGETSTSRILRLSSGKGARVFAECLLRAKIKGPTVACCAWITPWSHKSGMERMVHFVNALVPFST